MVPLSKIFHIRYGHSLELNRLAPLSASDGGIPFVSRKMGDNGISAYVAPIKGVEPAPAGELSCALSGNGVLSTFLQDAPFYTGFHVACLKPLIPLTREELLFYCTCIAANRYRFSYGRQANRTLRNILIPSVSDIPGYVHSIHVDQFEGSNLAALPGQIATLMTDKWRSFRLGNLFIIRKGQRLTKANMIAGCTPYIGASDAFNGVTASVGQSPIHSSGTISVSYNGSVAEAFYQNRDYWATDDVNVLYPNGFLLNEALGLFICTIIRLEKYRFNYGRKWHLERMRDSVIKLPATKEGTPDWEFMEKYIKSLPFSSQVL